VIRRALLGFDLAAIVGVASVLVSWFFCLVVRLAALVRILAVGALRLLPASLVRLS